MSQTMSVLGEPEKRRKLVGDGNGSVHAGQLVGDEARGIRLEGECDQVEHGMDQLARGLVVRIQVEALGIHLGSRNVKPLGGAFDILLDLPHRSKILVELPLVSLAQLAMQAFGLVEQQVEVAPGSGEPFSLGVDGIALQSKEPLKDKGGPVQGWDRLAAA